MNKNITVSFNLQKWYKNKVLADDWQCLLSSDIYSCLHDKLTNNSLNSKYTCPAY